MANLGLPLTGSTAMGFTLGTIKAAVKCKAKGESTLNCQSIEQQATLTQEQTVNGDNSQASATGSISQSASNSFQIHHGQ
jgi:hypothetical protein